MRTNIFSSSLEINIDYPIKFNPCFIKTYYYNGYDDEWLYKCAKEIGHNKFVIDLQGDIEMNELLMDAKKIYIFWFEKDLYNYILNFRNKFKYSSYYTCSYLWEWKYKLRQERSLNYFPDIIFDTKWNIRTDYGDNLIIKWSLDWDYICGIRDDGYIELIYTNNKTGKDNRKFIKMKDLDLSWYSTCWHFREISAKKYKSLWELNELVIDNKIIDKIEDIGFWCFEWLWNESNNYINIFNVKDEKFIGYKIKFFENKYSGNYTFLIYNKSNQILKSQHCEWMDWGNKFYYNIFVNWKNINPQSIK